MFSNKNRNIHAVIIALADVQFWIDRTYTNIVLLSYRISHTNTTHLSSSAASYHHLNKFQSKKLVTLQFLMPPSKFIAYFKFSNLLEFNVNQRWRNICNDLKGSGGKNHGSIIRWRPRNRRLCSINNLNLNGLTRNTSPRNSCTYTSHLIQPPTRCTIVPYAFSSWTKHVARWKLWRISPKTRRRCLVTFHKAQQICYLIMS